MFHAFFRAVCLFGFLNFSVAAIAQYSLETNAGCESGLCDTSGCDSGTCHSVTCDPCQPNKPCKRGTVGSLFRWSANPSLATLAQPDDPIVTDRPDFTEASSVVGLGVLQVESGYTYTRDKTDGTDIESQTYPETLLRYGMLANWLELRVAWTYADASARFDAFPGTTTSINGSDDLYLGLKIGLTPQDGWAPEMALIPQMTVPTGSSDISSNEVLAGANWLYGWDINDFLSAAGSTQFNRAIDGTTEDAYTQWAQSWTFGYSLSEKIGGYTEYYGFYPHSADTDKTEHYFNGGITYLINNDMLFDVRGGTGLNDNAADYFVGTGLSIRFR